MIFNTSRVLKVKEVEFLVMFHSLLDSLSNASCCIGSCSLKGILAHESIKTACKNELMIVVIMYIRFCLLKFSVILSFRFFSYRKVAFYMKSFLQLGVLVCSPYIFCHSRIVSFVDRLLIITPFTCADDDIIPESVSKKCFQCSDLENNKIRSVRLRLHVYIKYNSSSKC